MNKSSIQGFCAFSSAIALLGISLIAPAHGQATYFSETNKTVGRLGAQGPGFYMVLAEPTAQKCLWDTLYISPDKKGLYVQALAAKLTGKHLNRIDYSQPAGSGTTCNVELVEFSE